MTPIIFDTTLKIEKVLGSRKSIVYSASSSEGNRKQDVVSGWPELFDGKRHQGISLLKLYCQTVSVRNNSFPLNLNGSTMNYDYAMLHSLCICLHMRFV